MAIKTYTEQLEEVQAAISAIMAGGQTVKYDGRERTAADLDVLQRREEYLRKMVQRENAGGVTLTQMAPGG